jgi:large subunit ribosomal protein L25
LQPVGQIEIITLSQNRIYDGTPPLVFCFVFVGRKKGFALSGPTAKELVMAESVVLVIQERQGNGSRVARRLRKQGKVPAVLYGHGEGTVSVALAADELTKAIRHGARVIDLKQGDKIQKTLIRELQWDALGQDILHADFARVSADERITLDVRVELRGTAPGVTAGGVLVQQIHNLHVECPVASVPESIRVNVGELQMDQIMHVRDLVLPEGVVVKNDPDAIVVQVTQKVVEAETPAAPAAEQAEPEIIGKKKEEETEEAE